MQHHVGSVQDSAEQIELAAQDLEHQLLGFIVGSQEVDYSDVVLLPVTMTAPDALLNTLRIPG